MPSLLDHTVEYSGESLPVCWRGRHVTDAEGFRQYARERAVPRLLDAEDAAEFEADLNALTTTDYATETLTSLLRNTVEPQGWELGESLAEVLLSDEHGVRWPWNHARDKRTPKASLPGKDLIGFIESRGGFALLFGEVKSSSDLTTPPNVMYGDDGMVTQLVEAACEHSERLCLLKWLRRRCKNTELWSIFEQAVTRFLNSGGNDMVIWGVLVRDTAPSERDLKARATALAAKVATVQRVELDAWYFPVPIQQWRELLSRSEAQI
jgi:hypothetical protein